MSEIPPSPTLCAYKVTSGIKSQWEQLELAHLSLLADPSIQRGECSALPLPCSTSSPCSLQLYCYDFKAPKAKFWSGMVK